jgi:hypothetical protein
MVKSSFPHGKNFVDFALLLKSNLQRELQHVRSSHDLTHVLSHHLLLILLQSQREIQIPMLSLQTTPEFDGQINNSQSSQQLQMTKDFDAQLVFEDQHAFPI